MKNIAKLIKLTLLSLSSIIMFSCSDDDTLPKNNSITGIASENLNLTILVEALNRTNLAETLDQAGSYTVFAPTNGAFMNFLDENGFNSLDDVPVSTLTQILLNHVVLGTNTSNNLSTGYVKTLAIGSASPSNNLSMFINTESGVRLNGVSNVITANLIANNGVIHVVDAVIGLPTIVTHATANPNFSTLATLLTQQQLVETLNGTTSSPFTVFAPLNSAFDTATLNLYSGLTSTQKTAVLTYHVVPGANVLSNAIPSGPITTFESGTFSITGTVITDEQSRSTNIIATDVQASNGVIHAINKVLLPNLN
ncbi:fasciclin domain-containing protein [Flavobacterium cyclinae]|uniref:fasciclin domain-containing protein n=1 Tax=Flavobacterium cyclinae TaxID=2895947 RepID=UPI001E57176F|nr:fasciclin domain-containing protein [Flavobacterium cyclinae]UGS20266.1 fasciclin domain-containing protein [Flavobacterium cyclinae]